MLAVPLFGCGWLLEPKAEFEDPNPGVVVFEPNPVPVLAPVPPPKRPVVPVVEAPNVGLFCAPKSPPPVLALPKPVGVLLAVVPNPPNPVDPAVDVPLPKSPPPEVVVDPNGFAPKPVFVLELPKPRFKLEVSNDPEYKDDRREPESKVASTRCVER